MSTPPTPRLRSLDAFRGFDIVLMFFVNLSAADLAFPQWFEHAGWNKGLHGQWLADYVFPWFLFIVGCSIPFSMASGRGSAQTPSTRIRAALRRALLIYALGILIWMAKSAKDSVAWGDGGFIAKPGTAITWNTLLHWDILPLIALGYFLGVCIYHLPKLAWWLIAAAILIGKWLILPDLNATGGLTRSVWVASRTDLDDSIRAFDFLPGHFGNFLGTSLTQGLPATATVVLGMLAGHWLRAGSASFIPSAASISNSAHASSTGTSSTTKVRRALILLLAGTIATLIAIAWSSPLLGAGRLPISKDFFTSTYVLISAGTGCVVLALFYLALDALELRAWQWTLCAVAVICGFLGFTLLKTDGVASELTARWSTTLALSSLAAILLAAAAFQKSRSPGAPATAPFLTAYGTNALAIYIVAELTWTLFWMHWRITAPGSLGGQHAFSALTLWLAEAASPLAKLVTSDAQPPTATNFARGLGSWLATATYIALYFTPAAYLYRRKIFIKV
ncbi:MAG: heparan-alpha-glucosaminide N-acetyltransferase domain-containing protein [Phycisphaerales bacterium]|nr:heparan-alpha-glucosaminide N-acetyltransferase domain-containing protein [Phycisphaerales bacterium]